MKRLILCALALLMVLGVSSPALAFTSIEWKSDNTIPFAVGIRLVAAENGPLGVNFTAPAANKGYQRNEIVCAIATLYVPKNQDVAGRGYEYLVFSAENVSLDVMENRLGNDIALTTSANIEQANRVFTVGAGGLSSSNQVRFAVKNVPAGVNRDQEYHFAFFGKVIGDKAYMNVLLTKAKEFTVPADGSAEAAFVTNMGYPSDTTHLLFDDQYHLFRHKDGDTVWYTAASRDLTRCLFKVSASKAGKSERMMVVLPGATAAEDTWYEVVALTGGKLAFSLEGGNDFIMEGEASMPSDKKARLIELRDRYDDVVVGVFGLKAEYQGSAMHAEYFTDYGNVNDRFAEVAVAPWYADVNIPPQIEIDPPKTGDAPEWAWLALVLMGLAAAVVMRFAFKKVA